MDYKEEYQKALERAKKGLPIDEVFPELKASEDERIREQIVQVLIEHDWSVTYKVRRGDCIAWLGKQKEQKPAEWSEEDEAAFGDLIWCIEQARKSAKNENDMGNIWFAENWFKNRVKSLRPHWKPSEEQMEALARATNRCVGVDDAKILVKLLEQLEKL